MKHKLCIILGLVIVSAFLVLTVIQPSKVYAYSTTPKIIAGQQYAHVLKSDGTVYAWGLNTGSLSASMLGLGYSSSYEAACKQLSVANIKDMVTAGRTSFALIDNGNVLTWGENNLSQMGIGITNGGYPVNNAGYKSPTLHPYLSDVKRIITSKYSAHVFVILNDGTIKTWGYNPYGQLGTGNTANVYSPKTSAITDVKDIACGRSHTLLLKNNGTVYVSGVSGIKSIGSKSSFTLVSTLSDVSKIFAGDGKSFVVKTDGSVYAWGSNASGELGVGSIGVKNVPTLVPGLTNPSQIVSGANTIVALMPDGTVKTAGDNTYGQLGYSGEDVPTFITVPGITNAVQVEAGTYFTMVLLEDGSVITFGANEHAQLGFGYADSSVHLLPTKIPSLSLIPDITPPVITISNYNTNPTNKDITVTASTNEGTMNVTSHVFTENGNFEFVATDAAGNITTKTVTITNIDKTAPVVTIDNYITDPTNQDIVVTASTDEGSLNVTSHTFTSNDSFTFTATDVAGNTSTKTISITNIDKIVPIITIDPYDTNPTSEDVIVTASANEGSLNTTSHTFTSNGSFEFVATDAAGNVTTKTVTITNIDKTAPIITIGSYNTNPTNEDITITALVDKGTLNATSHTFTENGTFTFEATDNLGNVTDSTVTITNIDKIVPSNPVISVTANSLTIVSGTDGESGVKETLYQINDGEWSVYSDAVALTDGAYVIHAKTVDNAGNESAQVDYNTNVYTNAISTATNALVQAETTQTQSDLDTAMSLISALPECPEKTDLMNRVSNLQKVIDGNIAVSDATKALVKAENSYVQEDLDAAFVLISALPDSPEKTDLMNRANNLQKLINDKNAIYISTDTNELFRLQTINLTLNATGLDDLYTMQMEIHYNPELLELDQANINDLAWNNTQNGYYATSTDISNGVVKIIYSRKGDTQGLSGDNGLISLPFKALRIGKAEVEICKIKFLNSQGMRIFPAVTSVSKDLNILPNPLNITITGEKGQNDWYISPVTIEIDDIDAKEINYIIDGVSHSYSEPFSIIEIGEHNLKVTIADGNGYTKEEERVIKIDNNGPVISVNNPSGEWQNEVISVPGFDDQNGSGLSQSWYQWANTSEQPSQWVEYSQGAISQEAEGDWYLHIKAVDKAGNERLAVFGPYHIDITLPVISVDIDKREVWENTDVTVVPTFTDAGGSQLKFNSFQWSHEQAASAEYTPYTSGSLQQANDGTWYLHLKAEDGAGNIQTIAYGPYNIDKGSPDIKFYGISEGAEYTNSVTPDIVISDQLSGMKAQTITLDGQAYVSGTPVTGPGIYTISVDAEDNSNNSANRTISFQVVQKPVAVINMTPLTALTDTTPITWSYANSTDPTGGIIASAEWQLDSEPVTINPDGCVSVGTHTMRLRIKNNNDIWSDWSSVTFIVGYIYTIYPEDIAQLGDLSSGTVSYLYDADLDNQVVFDADNPSSGIEFSLLEPSTLYGLSYIGSDTGVIHPGGGMDVFKWNTATSTYDYIGKASVIGENKVWYQVFDFTQPGKYKMLVAQANTQGFSEWEFRSSFSNENTPPVAVISMTPATPDNTMVINWNYSGSHDADGDSIISTEWQLDDNPVTTTPPNGIISETGAHTMKLRVKDRKGTWSAWKSLTFEITEP